ncbi:MAG: CDP-alcohol phosphatidyltransferase family protein [Promethearchaeota archaeon]|nr:MAG: CDP-alcohol phosphatidyltransferase family protein [Candidatus Lokiarchaeota archaeon]
MIDNWLSKSRLKRKYELFVKKVLYKRISPNQLTLIGLALGLSSALTLFLSSFFKINLLFIILSVSLIVLSFFLDTLDGTLARIEGSTIFGGIMDIFCDRAVEISIILSVVSTKPFILMWPGLFSLAAMILCISAFLIVGAKIDELKKTKSDKVLYYPNGIMERTETFIFLFLTIILMSYRFILLLIFAILTFITALQRIIGAYWFFNKSNTK